MTEAIPAQENRIVKTWLTYLSPYKRWLIEQAEIEGTDTRARQAPQLPLALRTPDEDSRW